MHKGQWKCSEKRCHVSSTRIMVAVDVFLNSLMAIVSFSSSLHDFYRLEMENNGEWVFKHQQMEDLVTTSVWKWVPKLHPECVFTTDQNVAQRTHSLMMWFDFKRGGGLRDWEGPKAFGKQVYYASRQQLSGLISKGWAPRTKGTFLIYHLEQVTETGEYSLSHT
jgi:hypothetical protein